MKRVFWRFWILAVVAMGALTISCSLPFPTGGGGSKAGPSPAGGALKDNAPGRLNGIVAAHNVYRAQVGAPPLVWSDALAQVAQKWAEKLASENCSMYHHKTGYGENIGRWRVGKGSPENVVNRWMTEIDHYDYATNTCAPGKVCGHYKQIVWKDTRRVGCGYARCAEREVWVCNYDPPGNYRGKRPY